MEQQVLGWIGAFSYPAVLLLLLACGLGAPISEDLILVTAGLVASQAKTNLALTIAVAYVGVLGGDLLLYRVGRVLGPRAVQRPALRRVLTPARVARAQAAFARRKGLALFIARFVPGLRAPTFLMAGVTGVKPATFIVADGLAAAISVPLVVLLGHRFGGAVLEDLERVGSWILIAAALAGAIAFARWLSRRKIRALGET